MEFAYSPHREGGGTIHLASPTHRHGYGLEFPATIQQLRRSLSRSPSKPSRFHSARLGDSSGSPVSPLALARAYSPKTHYIETKPFFPDTPFSLPPKKRFPVRRNAPVRSSPRRRNPSRSPGRRALGDSSDQGNATPFAMRLSGSDEKSATRPHTTNIFDKVGVTEARPSLRPFDDIDDKPIKFDILQSRTEPPTPGAPIKPGSLKRTDDIMNFPAANVGTPMAKRRSVHGPSGTGGNDFDVFDQSETPQESDESSRPPKLDFGAAAASPFAPNPMQTPLRKSSSLRRTTLSQRYGVNGTQTKPVFDGEFAMPGPAAPKARSRMHFDNAQATAGAPSPFRRPPIPEASRQPFQSSFLRPANTTHQPHPLSNALSPSFSSPSGDDDATMGGCAPPAAPPRNHAFSKSLPLGAIRTFALESSTEPNFETPMGFKMAKPNPSAFMSTGLLTKKNRLVDESAINQYVMPGTPSKRASFPPVTASPSANRRNIFGSRIQRPEFGQPSTPFSLHKQSSSASFGKGVGIFGASNNNKSLRRASFASIDGDDTTQWPFGEINMDTPFGKHLSDSQSSHDDTSMPPTPTKANDGFGRRKDSSLRRQTFGRARSSLGADTFADPEDSDKSANDVDELAFPDTSPIRTESPHTPIEALADASFLSISGQRRASNPFNASTNSEALPPATPTTPRDYTNFFKSSGVHIAPIPRLGDNDVDRSLAERFDSFSLWGDGEFSKVYRAEKMAEPSPRMPTSPVPKVYAVKKTKKTYAGPSDREKKLKEVHILQALRGHEHVIAFEDSWEFNGHLYIQTEFCEEGNLQRFLANAGNKGRLDSFRIWKIMLEIASGLSHIHESGYIHLDLKPANILITFDGVLKIADFGLATAWPVCSDIDGEGDRHYLAPEALCGRYDKPCDIFAFGVIMCEVAGNLEMPENGESWQKLRSGDFSELPSLTWSSESTLDRDANGEPIDVEGTEEETQTSFASSTSEDLRNIVLPTARYSGGLAQPPEFMIDDNHPDSLDQIVQTMMNPDPEMRPTIQQIYSCHGCQWVLSRSRAGATIFEGNWGPSDDVLKLNGGDFVDEADRMDTD